MQVSVSKGTILTTYIPEFAGTKINHESSALKRVCIHRIQIYDIFLRYMVSHLCVPLSNICIHRDENINHMYKPKNFKSPIQFTTKTSTT